MDTIQEIQKIIPLISKICPNQFYLVDSTGTVLASSESQEIGLQHPDFSPLQTEDLLDPDSKNFRSYPLVVNGIPAFSVGIIGTREEAEKFTPILLKYLEMVIK